MAKKVRTPPPPARRVQAPKTRTGRDHAKRERITLKDRFNPVVIGVVVAVVVVAGVVGAVLATTGGGGKSQAARVSPQDLVGDMTKLPGILLTKPPWGPNNGAKLLPRLQTLGVPELGQEQLAFHIHQHLDVYVNG
jgi:hypothetical protein